ncbi:NAD(P)-binding domain-containing protein [Brachybacterium sp. MASK1Z-5]|uniref:NAD(P)-binding domain-containing protein n=2 Tax=Brachybacterium halotolerans TaxID=2795215 RepID=A0ABS1BAA7_9MICO|nr:NAD(P)-binding domain-containing protein [Brachybacterium halotolerans]
MEAAESTEVVIVGAGQSGIAASAHLTRLRIPHLVLEKADVADRWRHGRWDSLVANGPAWHDRFPTMEIPGVGPDEFATKDQMADYFGAFARSFDAPVRTGVEVLAVTRRESAPGFLVETSAGTIVAGSVIAATGPFQVPVAPRIISEDLVPHQIHSAAYRNPHQLPEGGVLVVGAGSSGAQIAEELRASGRQVHLSVGPHDRPPRSYRDRDFVWWLGALGKWDATAPDSDHVTIAVSGARGGHTVDFRELAAAGITLVGRTEASQDGTIRFADDLRRNITAGDANLLELLEEADAYVEANGLNLPEEPEAHELGDLPACVTDPVRSIDPRAAGITSIIWATGYAQDFTWLHVDAFDATGRPAHLRGVSTESGIYFLGLPWLSRRGSSFIWGTWHDAMHVADHIATRRRYAQYAPAEQGASTPTAGSAPSAASRPSTPAGTSAESSPTAPDQDILEEITR